MRLESKVSWLFFDILKHETEGIASVSCFTHVYRSSVCVYTHKHTNGQTQNETFVFVPHLFYLFVYLFQNTSNPIGIFAGIGTRNKYIKRQISIKTESKNISTFLQQKKHINS